MPTLTSPSDTISGTARMLLVPEAGPARAASGSLSARFPIASARCATTPVDEEWVPNAEATVVPEVMAALCRRCPARSNCLQWALENAESGYWAGTTSADRAQMCETGQHDIAAADSRQEEALQRFMAGADHSAGSGSYRRYRAGCRCGECRAANAATRAEERVRARERVAA